MLLPPYAFALAILPPLVLTLLRARMAPILFATAATWAALAALTMALTPAPTPPTPGSHPVSDLDFTGLEAVIFWVFAAGFGLAGVTQWSKERLDGRPDRTLALIGAWLVHGALVTALIAPPELAGSTALGIMLIAGLATSATAILGLPLARRLRKLF